MLFKNRTTRPITKFEKEMEENFTNMASAMTSLASSTDTAAISAAISSEATARVNAIAAEATAREDAMTLILETINSDTKVLSDTSSIIGIPVVKNVKNINKIISSESFEFIGNYLLPSDIIELIDVVKYSQTHNIIANVSASASAEDSDESYSSVFEINIDDIVVSEDGSSLAINDNIETISIPGDIESDIRVRLDSATRHLIFEAESYNSSEDSTAEEIVADGAPSARYNHKSAIIGQFIYILGGLDIDDKQLKDFWRYDIIENTWTQLVDFEESMNVDSKNYSNLLSVDGKLFIGSRYEDGDYKGITMNLYDELNDTWSAIFNARSVSINTNFWIYIYTIDNNIIKFYTITSYDAGYVEYLAGNYNTSSEDITYNEHYRESYSVNRPADIFGAFGVANSYKEFSLTIRSNTYTSPINLTGMNHIVDYDKNCIYFLGDDSSEENKNRWMFDITNELWIEQDSSPINNIHGSSAFFRGFYYSFGGIEMIDGVAQSATNTLSKGIIIPDPSTAMNWNVEIQNTISPKYYDGPEIVAD